MELDLDFGFANSPKEKAYFMAADRELIHALHEEQARVALETKQMKCPNCGHDLEHAALGAAMIERCASCGGVFLSKEAFEHVVKTRSQPESFVETLHTLLVGDTQPSEEYDHK